MPLFHDDQLATKLIKDTKPDHRLVYLMMQDMHVASQRIIYEEYKKIFSGPSSFILSMDIELNRKWFYYILLKERFKEEPLTPLEAVYHISMKTWLEKHAPPCPICGLATVGEMCRGSRFLPDPKLYLVDCVSLFD